MAQTGLDDAAEAPYRRFASLANGFRKDWNPPLPECDFRRKPKPVRLLREAFEGASGQLVAAERSRATTGGAA